MSSAPAGVPVAETVVQVRSPELDAFGHVNHATFLHYLEHARFEALEAAGFPSAAPAGRSRLIFGVRIEVDYLGEARVADVLTVKTWADGVGRTTMDLAQEVVRVADPGRTPAPGPLVTRARVRAVRMGPDRRSMRVPAEVRSGLLHGRPA